MKKKRPYKEFRVGTFFHKTFVTAYLRDYSPEWGGCIEYIVKANSGKEAKIKAIKERNDYEFRGTK